MLEHKYAIRVYNPIHATLILTEISMKDLLVEFHDFNSNSTYYADNKIIFIGDTSEIHHWSVEIEFNCLDITLIKTYFSRTYMNSRDQLAFYLELKELFSYFLLCRYVYKYQT